MKKITKLLSLIFSICLLISLCGNDAQAASGNMSVSSASGTVGSTVTVTGRVTASEAIGAATVTLTYDPSGLQYVSGSQDVTGGSGRVTYFGDAMGQNKTALSFSVTFKILKEGSFRVSGVVDSYTDANMDKIAISGGGGTITGKAVTTPNPGTNPSTPSNPSNPGTSTQPSTPSQDDNKDKNSKLTNLLVHPGTMSPAFNQGTTSYKVEVPSDTTEVTISATAQSSKATVSVSGGKDLKTGENNAKVVVTAENGSVTVYNITIIRGEEEKEIIKVNGTDNTIDETFVDDKIPEGFVREKITYNGKEYEALKHAKADLQLISLHNDAAGPVFYIYNQVTQEFYNFVQVQIAEGKNIIPLPLKEIKEFANYELVVLTLKDKSFDAWKIDDEYSLLPFLTVDGEEIIYQYDNVDGTLQRYAGPVSEVEVTEPVEIEKPFWEKYSMYIIAGLGILVLILIIAFICVAVEKRNRPDEDDYHAESSYVEPRKQPKEVEEKPKKKKRKHDARRRKAIKRMQKQKMKENRL